ncbi:hypothetical protein FRX31_014586 [Thalictrum thalictroides]|uniref:Uncharacterized protein n=1 Tax=Thalictrum thalictroides TaxID=46969 RepID=A0A7J6WFZ2_THATH|nr:hypothetical protein FRX31_014586 [Thalictrum thalictroides]
MEGRGHNNIPPSNPSYIFTPCSLALPSFPSSLIHLQQYQPASQPQQDSLGILTGLVYFFAPNINMLGVGDPSQQLSASTSSTVTVRSRGDGEINNDGKDKGKSSRSKTKKVCRPRFAFQTRSTDDILDDGY